MKKLILVFISVIALVLAILVSSYLYFIPKLLKNPDFLNFVQKTLQKNCDIELVIDNPILDTGRSLSFKIDKMTMKKDNELLLNLDKFNAKLDFSKILSRKIILDELGADEIYVDVNGIQKLNFKQESKKEQQKPFFSIDCFNTRFYIKKCIILYESKNNVKVRFFAKDFEISSSRDPKFLHFKIFLDLDHNKQHLRLFLKDKDTIYFKDKKLHVDNFGFWVNRSKINVKALIEENNHYNVSVESNKFEIENVNRFLKTNLVIPNGNEVVSCFKDFSGDLKFKINMTEKGLNGNVDINRISVKLIPVANLPLTLTSGSVILTSNDIDLRNFKGYYGVSSKHKISMKGRVEDYTKTAKTSISVMGFMYDEFAKYVSKIANINLSIINGVFLKTDIEYANNAKLKILVKIALKKGSDILFDGVSISPVDFCRAYSMDMDIWQNILSINHINYYIEDSFKNLIKKKFEPLVTVKSKIDIVKGTLNEIEFNIPKPLPSEFMNAIVNQRIFKNGTLSGNMKLVFADNPHIEGSASLKDAIVLGQGVFIKNMEINSDKKYVNIKSDGLIRLSKYKFNANILNKVVFPIVIEDIALNFDEMNVDRVMKTFAPRPKKPIKRTSAQTKRPKIELAKSDISTHYFEVKDKQVVTNSDEVIQVAFQPNIVEIKKCILYVGKGVYKQITFGNLNANLTLTKNGILQIQSNKFDFTDGISTLKVYCDLLREKYYIRLGAKDVDTNVIFSSILNLDKEISGKAKALIELNTDSSLKLNGKIQFAIDEGTIAKLGMVRYVLNVASVFRNPIVKISPSTLFDIINMPEGTFKKINGTFVLKDNSIDRMFIKSISPQLAALMFGRINLETNDASMRIYTKFSDENKGIVGFMRGMSLNSLAQKASFYVKDEERSYYASELSQLPKLEIGEENAQVFVTQLDGDIQTSNFISIVKKLK